MKQTHTCAQEVGQAQRGRGCCFVLLVGLSVLWCVPLMDDRRTTKKDGPEEYKQRRAQRQSAKIYSRLQRRCELVCLLSRGDPERCRMIYRDISCYDIPYHAMLQYTILWRFYLHWATGVKDPSITYPTQGELHNNVSRYHTSKKLRTDINIVPHRNICRHRTPVCTTSRGKDNLHMWRHTLKIESNHQPSTDDDSIKLSVVLRCQKPRAKKEGQRVYMKRTSICCCCCCCCCFRIKPFFPLYDISSAPSVLLYSSF